MDKLALSSPASVEESLCKLAELISTFNTYQLKDIGTANSLRHTIEATKWLASLRQLLLTTEKAVAHLQQGRPVRDPRKGNLNLFNFSLHRLSC